MLKALARKGLKLADGVALAIAPVAQEHDALVTVLFHSLSRERSRLPDPSPAPNLNVNVEEFRAFVGTMLDSGYCAVSCADIGAGLPRGGKYLAITFDDGYFNNTLALDVLEQFRAPATFFISAQHVLQDKAFWWDAFSRELSRSGVSARDRAGEMRKLKSMTPGQIDRYLQGRLGKAALRPHSDQDRPFTPGELKDFARNKWVHIGNHTCDHAILTNCAPREVEQQIRGCQDALQDLVGYAPLAIAYPNGNFSQEVVGASVAAGLRVGFTVLPRRDRLPLTARNRMTLGRFQFEGGKDAHDQCRKFSAGFVPSHLVKTLLHSPPRKPRESPALHRHA